MGDLGRLTREPRQRKIERSHAASELEKWFSGLGHLCKQEGVSLNPQHHVKARHDCTCPSIEGWRRVDPSTPIQNEKLQAHWVRDSQKLKWRAIDDALCPPLAFACMH